MQQFVNLTKQQKTVTTKNLNNDNKPTGGLHSFVKNRPRLQTAGIHKRKGNASIKVYTMPQSRVLRNGQGIKQGYLRRDRA